MLFIYRYILGYLTVKITGEYNENILNICAKNRIVLWNTRLVKSEIEANILIKDFKRLKNLIRKTKCRIHILEKKGLPLKTKNYKNRYGLFLGIIIIILILNVLSNYIWVITVNGNKKIPSEEILKNCEKIGIKPSIKISKLNPKNDRERLILLTEDLAWCSLNIEGSKLTVNVTEVKKEKAKTKSPTNLKASADGIINKIDIKSGNCVVKVGDAVKKGDLLVSGIIEGLSGTHFVNSSGKILAVTKEEYKIEKEYNSEIIINTGEYKIKKVLEVFSLKIPLYLGGETKNYTSSKKVNTLKIFNQELPIKIHTKEITYIETKPIKYNYDTLLKQAEKELKEKIKENKIKEYTIKNQQIEKHESGITLTVLIETKRNIAESQELLKTDYSVE